MTRRSSLQARKGSFFNLQTVASDLERNLRSRVFGNKAAPNESRHRSTGNQENTREIFFYFILKRSINITINTKYCTKSGLNYLKSGRTSIKDSKGREVDLPHI